MKPLLAAIRFLTIVPVPGNWGTAEEDLAGSVPLFPVVGLLLGAVAAGAGLGPGAGGAAAGGRRRAGRRPAELLRLPAPGRAGRHGRRFLSSRSRERILEIMKDSHIGAMGVIAIVCVLLVKFAALASLPAGAALAGRAADAAGRALRDRGAHGPVALCPAEGLGSVFYRRRPRWAAVWAAAVLAAAAWASWAFAGPLGQPARERPAGRTPPRPARWRPRGRPNAAGGDRTCSPIRPAGRRATGPCAIRWRIARPAASAVRPAKARRQGATPSAANFNSNTQTMAITPIAPTWLSFMISRIRSRERELKKPSAVSESPSRCRQPEKLSKRMMIAAPTSIGDATSDKAQATAAATPPTNRPTTGNQGTLPARSSSAVPQLPGRGKIVRNRRAAKSCFMASPSRRGPSTRGPRRTWPLR